MIHFLFFALISSYNSNAIFEHHACRSQIEQALSKAQSTNHWIEVAPSENNTHLFRSPTEQIGQWVQLQINDDRTTSLLIIDSEKSKKISFDKNCAFKQEENAIVLKSKKTSVTLTDHDLQKMIKNNESVLIYSWSPGMVYSMKYSGLFAEAAKKLGLRFVSVVDPRFSKDKIERAITQFPTLGPLTHQSTEIIMREATVHYPSVLIIHNRKISRQPIVGVYTAQLLEAKILLEKDKLK